ncbi:MAG: hypothetical protein ACKVOW_21415 [Chitinophagaceae bacterium]
MEVPAAVVVVAVAEIKKTNNKLTTPTIMFARSKNVFWAISLVSCYTLYAVGQIWLFISKQQEEEFYTLVTKYSSDWINAHLILMLSLLLILPAYFAIKNYLRDCKRLYWIDLSIFFICLWVFVLFGQFTIDLCIVELFKLPQEKSYEILDQIQANTIINALFYNNSKLFILFKVFDFGMLAQLCLLIAMIVSRKIPKWAIVVFIAGLLLTTFGILLHPVYGRIIKRVSYSFFSISFLPIALYFLKNYKTDFR